MRSNKPEPADSLVIEARIIQQELWLNQMNKALDTYGKRIAERANKESMNKLWDENKHKLVKRI